MADPGGQGGGGNASTNPGYPYATDPRLPHNHASRIGTADATYDRARNQILSVWSDRLQLVSVLATFFTSIDSLLFSLATNIRDHTNLGQLMSAAFAGSLVFHAAAAILAFLGAFVLIRYKLADARAHMRPDAGQTAPATFNYAPSAAQAQDVRQRSQTSLTGEKQPRVSEQERPSSSTAPFLFTTPATPTNATSPPLLVRTTTFFDRIMHTPLFVSADITIELVWPFSHKEKKRGLEGGPDQDAETRDRTALERLLLRCHRACSLFVMLGFTLLVIGVVTFAWVVLDRAVSVFVSSCVAVSLAIAVFVLV